MHKDIQVPEVDEGPARSQHGEEHEKTEGRSQNTGKFVSESLAFCLQQRFLRNDK